MATLEYTCVSCGERHVGLPSPGWAYPIHYVAIPQAERDRRARLTSDTCIIDNEYFFIRACLDIHVHGVDEPLSWGIWVSLSRESFDRYLELYEDQARTAGEYFFGWFCSPISAYPMPQNLKTHVHVRPWPERPSVELEPTDHPLAIDQRNGITMERAIELIQPFLHAPQGTTCD